MTNEPSQYIDEEPPESESDLIWGLTKIGHAAGGKTEGDGLSVEAHDVI